MNTTCCLPRLELGTHIALWSWRSSQEHDLLPATARAGDPHRSAELEEFM